MPTRPQLASTCIDETETTGELHKLLRIVNPHKTCEPDGTSPSVLQELTDELAPALILIYNSSPRNDIIHVDWRTAFVTPVFKKGECSP